MGTPYCITIDEETINNGTVTIRLMEVYKLYKELNKDEIS